MAIIKKGLLSGRVGNVVYKVVNGRSVVSSYPRRKKGQFEPKEQHGRFGLAVKISSRVYHQLKDFHLNLVSSDLYNKLTSFFINQHLVVTAEEPTGEWLRIADGDTLPLNRNIQPRHILRINPTMKLEGEQARVWIPNFDSGMFFSNQYRMPRGIVSLQYAVMFIHYNFETENAQVVYLWESDRYSPGADARKANLVLEPQLVDAEGAPLGPGIILSAFNIRTYANQHSMAFLNNKNFNPSTIMGVWVKRG